MLPFMLSKNPKIKQLANSYKKTWPSFCKAHEPEGIHIFNQKLLRGNTAGWLKKMFGKNGGCMGLFQNMSEKINAISNYQDDSNPLLNGKIWDAL